MPRVPYQPDDLAEPRTLVDAIRARRGGKLLHLDRMLLHSPPFAGGWNVFLRAVRNDLTLPPKLRELSICAVAVLNDAKYEYHHHAPEFLRAGGTPAQANALLALDAVGGNGLFDAAELAVLRFTMEMTRNVHVSEKTFAAVKTALPDDRQLVELVGVVATYNMVSRFLTALEIEPEQPATSAS
jgi:alkylhydroperoxidase family enzyme